MYSTCLFCQSSLGENDAIEHFPVGRRLAFDGAKGRLWVVCRKCERWNLTPLEDRWEAIEECERLFRATRLRVSTDQIGLARLKEGLELVRIGQPLRPEMAAWRYGDQFGRRRRRYVMVGAGAVAAVGLVAVAGPMTGLIGFGAFGPTFNILNFARALYSLKKTVPLSAEQDAVRVRLSDVPKTRLYIDRADVTLRVSGVRGRFDRGSDDIELKGADALRAAGVILPLMNRSGGSEHDVERAVGYLEDAGDTQTLFQRAARAIEERDAARWVQTDKTNVLSRLPIGGRLALEMAVHEESERRALEGELHVLEAAWKDAEDIAKIADDMFLPASVDEDLTRLKRKQDE